MSTYQNNDRPKDPLFSAKSAKMGQNSKGGDRIEFSMYPEVAVSLAIQLIQEVATVTPETTISEIAALVESTNVAIAATREMDKDVAKLEQLKARKSFYNPRGAKLDIHLTNKPTNDGREFLSGILFSKGIQEFGSQPRPDSSASAPSARPSGGSTAGAKPVSGGSGTFNAAKAAVDKLRRPSQ